VNTLPQTASEKRTLVIGDIHGCQLALSLLLHVVKPQPDDELIFLGDYVDRGPSSRGVLEMLIALEKRHKVTFLLGNHEVMMLQSRKDPLQANLWQACGGLETVESYGAASRSDWAQAVPETHWYFISRLRKFHETDLHIFVHACLDPELDLKDQPDWILFWELFDSMRPHKSGKRIICGHTAQGTGMIKDLGFATCIDTGAVFDGWLTCLDARSNRFWQANERGQKREGKLFGNV
jgi:serine/threonine protein phosphatase 1